MFGRDFKRISICPFIPSLNLLAGKELKLFSQIKRAKKKKKRGKFIDTENRIETKNLCYKIYLYDHF